MAGRKANASGGSLAISPTDTDPLFLCGLPYKRPGITGSLTGG